MKNKLSEICHNATEKDNFVGLKCLEDKIEVYFPLGYQIPTDNKECQNSILNLIRAIHLVKNEKNGKQYSEIPGDYLDMPINSYIWLINDYLTNSLYYDLEKCYKQKINGKINWKRTIKTQFYISDDNIIYLNPMIEKNSREENLITMIQIVCLQKSIERIGWLFDKINLPNINMKENTITYYIDILKKQFQNSYVDHKKQLINHMILILEEKNNEKVKSKSAKFGTHNFNIAWEKMVTKVYGSLKSNDFFPHAKYHLIGEKEFNTYDMYPDTLCIFDHNLYILDSKYYKYGITGLKKDLPSTESIEKQITYGEYGNNSENKKKYEYDNVYNTFILPWNSRDKEKVIEYRGYAESGSSSKQGKHSYEKIAIILIDTKYLMDCYFKREAQNKEKLVKAIHNIK